MVCTLQLSVPKYWYLVSGPYLRGRKVSGFNPPPPEMLENFKVNVAILRTTVHFFCSLRLQIICIFTFEFVLPLLFAFIV